LSSSGDAFTAADVNFSFERYRGAAPRLLGKVRRSSLSDFLSFLPRPLFFPAWKDRSSVLAFFFFCILFYSSSFFFFFFFFFSIPRSVSCVRVVLVIFLLSQD